MLTNKIARRALVRLSIMVLAVAGAVVGPAAGPAAASPTEPMAIGNYPEDCTVYFPEPSSSYVELTCTNRPGEQWRLYAYCLDLGFAGEAWGNEVWGNGTSAGTCSGGEIYAWFQVSYRVYPYLPSIGGPAALTLEGAHQAI